MRILLLLSSLALGAGLARPAPQPRPPVRPDLDEMLEEQRGACDAVAGDALQACLATGG